MVRCVLRVPLKTPAGITQPMAGCCLYYLHNLPLVLPQISCMQRFKSHDNTTCIISYLMWPHPSIFPWTSTAVEKRLGSPLHWRQWLVLLQLCQYTSKYSSSATDINRSAHPLSRKLKIWSALEQSKMLWKETYEITLHRFLRGSVGTFRTQKGNLQLIADLVFCL